MKLLSLQRQRMVEDLTNKGKLKNCLVICDVLGSMSMTTMEVSVALGVLVSELSEEPCPSFRGFEIQDEFRELPGDQSLPVVKTTTANTLIYNN